MSLGPTARQRLLKLQKNLFQQLQADASRLVGHKPQSIENYEREYRRDFSGFSRKMRSLSKEALVQSIRSSDVTFIADFHTFAQAQRTALRIMRSAIRPGENWALGLELVPSTCQRALDDFQSGKINLGKFHRAIRYDQDWGFPWENYEPIFKWARENSVRLIALNQPRDAAGSSRLDARDEWAAERIVRALEDDRKPLRMLVLFGELHVSRNHLPRQVERITRASQGKTPRSTIIHQNYDPIYWKLASAGKAERTTVLRLSPGVFCVVSGTPWSKAQSIISWTEGELPVPLHGDADELVNGFDQLSMLALYGNAVAEFLGVPAPSFENLTIRTIRDAVFFDELAKSGIFGSRELRIIRHQIAHHQILYIPRAKIAYLASSSQNGLTELASMHLLSSLNHHDKILDSELDDFFRAVIESAFAFFCSLLMNPKRKCDMPIDHRRRLSEFTKSCVEQFRHERLAREIALSVLQSLPHPSRSRLLRKSMQATPLAPACFVAARFVGRIAGKKMHRALLTNRLRPLEILKLCLSTKTARTASYEASTVKILRLVASSQVERTKTAAL